MRYELKSSAAMDRQVLVELSKSGITITRYKALLDEANYLVNSDSAALVNAGRDGKQLSFTQSDINGNIVFLFDLEKRRSGSDVLHISGFNIIPTFKRVQR